MHTATGTVYIAGGCVHKGITRKGKHFCQISVENQSPCRQTDCLKQMSVEVSDMLYQEVHTECVRDLMLETARSQMAAIWSIVVVSPKQTKKETQQ